MNHRERMLAVLGGQAPDRIPWSPRVALWYNARRLTDTLPPAYKGLSLREVERALGVACPARDGSILQSECPGLAVETRRIGNREITEYLTPVGRLQRVVRFSDELERQGLPGRIVEYPLKAEEDYCIWEWIIAHTQWRPDYEAYQRYDAEIGDDGLPMVSVGDVPFHHWLENLAGYEYGFYHLADFPATVERLLGLMAEVERERLWPVIAQSPARFLLHGAHLSTQFTPPRYFSRYILPYYRAFMPLMHAHGKAVAMHADHDTSAILELIVEAGWDLLECFVTAPMVPLTLERAREVLGNRVVIWGGLPSALLAPHVPEKVFRDYVAYILRTVAPGDAFVLGVSDNVMPDSVIGRIAWVTEYLAEHGAYPLEG
jgi:hypothetical protein